MNLYIFAYLLQSTMKHTTSQTRQAMTLYWKTSTRAEVEDYWNHGLVFIPGLQGIYTITTKKPDIFPPWLTRSTSKTSRTSTFTTKSSKDTPETTTEKIIPSISHTKRTTSYIAPETVKEKTTPKTTTEEPTTTEEVSHTIPILTITPKSTTKLAQFIYKEPAEYYDEHTVSTKKKMKLKSTIKTTATTKTTTLKTTATTAVDQTSNDEEEEMTEPFSTFLRNLFKALSAKTLQELAALVDPIMKYISQYVSDSSVASKELDSYRLAYYQAFEHLILQLLRKMLVTLGKLHWLGQEILSYITTMIDNTSKLAPDMLWTPCYRAHSLLANRKALSGDTNAILDALDDLYDEGEEEAMQEVLRQVNVYPNTDRVARDIARSFIDDVFLNPIRRVANTFRGNNLLKMITEAIRKRNSVTNVQNDDEYFDDVRLLYDNLRNGNGDIESSEVNMVMRSYLDDFDSPGLPIQSVVSKNGVKRLKRNDTIRSRYTELNLLLPNKKHRKHKGHRHKHAHSRHGKLSHDRRKYKKLKRKYHKLKRLYNKRQGNSTFNNNVTHNVAGDEPKKGLDINANVLRNAPDTDYNSNNPELEPKHEAQDVTPKREKEHLDINLFLEDFDDDNVKFEGGIPLTDKNAQLAPRYRTGDKVLSEENDPESVNELPRKIDDYRVFVPNATQRYPNSRDDPNLKAIEYSDVEFNLKENLYDAFRHMDFINNSVARRSLHHLTPVVNVHDDSPETDIEAVLKSNIYKAVKKTLKH